MHGNRSVPRCSIGLLLAALQASPLLAAKTPVTVSPGSADRVAIVEARCPTFSWGEAEDALRYELVVYRTGSVEAGGGAAEVAPVLREKLPGSVYSWTPAMDRCLAVGERYAWAVRSIGAEGASGWSEARLFSISDSPSVDDVRDALRVLERYAAREEQLPGPEAAGEADARGKGFGRSDSPTAIDPYGLATPFATGLSALRAEQSDATGETSGVQGITRSSTERSFGVVGEALSSTGVVFGVAGVTGSADGAGVVAFNQADGPDLILAGEPWAAFLTEWGFDRPSDADLLFSFFNSDEGTLNVNVDGGLAAAYLSGEGSLLTNLNANELSTGVVAMAYGGTGATDSATARINLGVAGGAHTTDTTCDGIVCNGSLFTNLNANQLSAGMVPNARIGAGITRDAEVLPIVLAGDGPGSTLNADFLDGLDSADLQDNVIATGASGSVAIDSELPAYTEIGSVELPTGKYVVIAMSRLLLNDTWVDGTRHGANVSCRLASAGGANTWDTHTIGTPIVWNQTPQAYLTGYSPRLILIGVLPFSQAYSLVVECGASDTDADSYAETTDWLAIPIDSTSLPPTP